MWIEKIHINNFRNLNNINIIFDEDVNYILGENNIGKSNLLDLLYLIGNRSSFNEEDFTNPDMPIEVIITLCLDKFEIGIFDDNFCPGDACKIKLKIYQDFDDARLGVINVDTGQVISNRLLKKINIVKYESNKNPNLELRFDKKQGAAYFLSFIIDKYISDEDLFIEDEKINSLLKYVNGQLHKIKALKDFRINASFSQNTSDMLSRLVYLMDENSLPISETGSGVQFTAMATLSILTRILELYKSKSNIIDEYLIVKKDGKKILPIIIAIDEPEVHLHPYMQRSLINYYKRIIKNKDSDFLELLKDCFDIDGLDGQLFIVTHSTDALVDNYKNIIRFYRDNNVVKTVSGKELDIPPDIEKHLAMHFPEIKEAFFSKAAIIVEGETEYGCMKAFADKIDKSLDDYGICLINARAGGTERKIKMLLKHFEIPSVLIFDKDIKEDDEHDENEFYTEGVCFETDIVNILIHNNKHEILNQIILKRDANAYNHVLDKDFVKKPFNKINYNIEDYQPRKLNEFDINNIEEYRAIHFAWLYNKKGIILGRIIGEILEEELIPQTYKDAC